jgi:TonB family protein
MFALVLVINANDVSAQKKKPKKKVARVYIDSSNPIPVPDVMMLPEIGVPDIFEPAVALSPPESYLIYPQQALASRKEGRVRVLAMVDTAGMVSHVSIETTTDTIFDEAAMDALKQVRFTPGRQEGELTTWIYTHDFEFKLPRVTPAPVPPRSNGDPRDEFVKTEIEPVAIEPIAKFLEYPEMAKRAGIEGDVTLQALIAKDGTVLRVRILKSSNFVFEKPAFDAMHKVRYKPATSSGKPVQAWVTERVIFKLH